MYSILSFITSLLKILPELGSNDAFKTSLLSLSSWVITLIFPKLNLSPSDTDNIISNLFEVSTNWAIDEVNKKLT